MRPIGFTREDFNNVLNYHDIRSSEFSLTADGEAVEPDFLCSHFTSNTDVVPDSVSPARVKNHISDAESYVIKVRKPHPFHEAFIDDLVDLSRRHLYAYTPVLIAARNASVREVAQDGLPIYARAFSGGLRDEVGGDVRELQPGALKLSGDNLLVLYTPNPKLQREVVIRVFRKKVRAGQPSAVEIFSLRDRREFFTAVSRDIGLNTLSENDEDLFFHTLMQIWPCGARHRLSSYVLMKENAPDVVAKLIPWNTRIADGKLVSIGGKEMPDSEISRQIVEGGIKRTYMFERGPEADRLVVEGILGYRRRDKWRFSGWPVTASGIDPTVKVRTDGISRWMCMGHGGLESIESLEDGSNKTIGGSFIQDLLEKRPAGRKLLFLGLGLGVIQRGLMHQHDIRTVEANPAVIEIFRQLYPSEAARMRIDQGDFFDHLGRDDRVWDGLVLDFYDPDLTVLSEQNVGLMLTRLAPNGAIIINKQGDGDAFKNRLRDAGSRAGLVPEFYELSEGQAVAVLSR